ncbi:MAG TPA: betaine/proline/choline family ABC transporter ATP-binding protein [Clostridia bacterium]|nr:betaine/proline/choline family ABC transporter ATP-binding protein [Clostridia bacterium]
MIRFENVTKQYDLNSIAVDNLNLHIRKGEILILIGPSGCGKTTTMKMINRLIEPTSGKIYIQGEDAGKLDPVELRRNIGYVIQQIGLFPQMTIGENIALVPKLKKWPEQKRRERVEELLHLVGLPPEKFRDKYPFELSGGQQQRVGVARALAADPPIILMDEPFGALDPITREQLQDELLQLQLELQKTIVFVTHDIDEALKLGTRIALMREGKIVQLDTPDRLLRTPENDFVRDFIGRDRLIRQPETLKVEDIMNPNPVTMLPTHGLAEGLDLMRKRRVDSLLIIDRFKKLIGIVTIKDMQQNLNQACQLAEIMTSEIITVVEGTGVREALDIMAGKRVGYLPVVDRQGRLKGLITRTSLVNVLAETLWKATS